ALNFEASVASRMFAESQVVHDAGGEEQLLVVGCVVQRALMFGKQTREEEASDAVVRYRLALRRADEFEARVDQRPCREREELVHAATVALHRTSERWPVGHLPLRLGH